MAAFDGYCLIDSAGIDRNGTVHFFLKAVDGTFDWSPFVAKKEHSREILAIALAAIASHKRVRIQTEATTHWTEVLWFDILAS